MEPVSPSVQGIDLDQANPARMYDYFLGGRHNFPVDRERAEEIMAQNPGTQSAARSNRVFLREVVRACLDRGITQFLDLGSGVPTAGNVHEVVHGFDPAGRVAYVDHEPVAVAHARDLIDRLQISHVTVTQADLRRPDQVLAAPGVRELLDFNRPIAVLMIAVLHFVGGDDASRAIAGYRSRLATGSVIAISHTSDDQDDPELAERLRAVGNLYRHTTSNVFLRSRASLREILTGLEIVEPGLVDVSDWPRPDVTPGRAGAYGALGVVVDNGSTSSDEKLDVPSEQEG